ncbi:hypothetical protein pdul_cds_579 [Pandoravirus dulcis]|uniref:Uncharacterized protein n=1 Tax=Pandoravirus dulcis TaxID=1349409 RepID=S4VTF4_9VIRU|nr:hypothetical protein pdul_cds_579 [Pandoravirus dulcis]AGO82700.1 hypothetical protein pdul_cds_579 [Pandoravirus dulcis]
MQGTKRPREPTRPDVATAVGLCAQWPALSVGQWHRLNEIATRLGAAGSPEGPCGGLARVLGDEWTDALARADLFAAEETRRTRSVPIAARGVGAAFPVPTPPPVPTGWADLPLEMQVRIIHMLADRDPRAVLDFYASGPGAARALANESHVVFSVDDQGALVERRVPLLDYARAATAFGVDNALDLFLASAKCWLKALANWYTVAERHEGAFAPPGREATRDPQAVDYADAVDAGLPDDVPEGAPTTGSAGITLRDLRAILVGPVPGSPAEVARQWYDYVRRPSVPRDAPAPPQSTTVVGARFWAMGVGPSRVARTVLDHALDYGIVLPASGDVDDDQLIGAMRLIGSVPRENAYAWLRHLIGVDDDDLADWIAGRPTALDDEDMDVEDRLHDYLDGDEDAFDALIDDLDMAVRPYMGAGACQAYLWLPDIVPPFVRLFSASHAAVTRRGGRMWLFWQPRSTAIEQALALAAARDAS